MVRRFGPNVGGTSPTPCHRGDALDECTQFPGVPAGVADHRSPRRARASRRREASCAVMAHWGEIIQGPVLIDGRPQVGLVTLPDPTHWVTATATAQRPLAGISCTPPGKTKALRAARLLAERWGASGGVQLDLVSTIPEGVGAGSSTADCTAAVCALSELLGLPRGDRDALAVIFAAEGPCDPLLLLDEATTLLWGSRCGRLFRRYERPLPVFHAIGFVTDPGRTVSTVHLAARQRQHPPTTREIDAFAVVLHDFEQALATDCRRGVAHAATVSGSLNQERCALDGWDALRQLAEGAGALGVSCAHSGTAAALLFDPAVDDLAARCAQATRHLHERRVAHIHPFRTEARPPRWAATHDRQIQS
jgi:uncharacterized protein involved in propanediol utilization